MNKVIKKPELLAPAGNLEKVKWAIMYGADAVYFGGQNYSLRANADNLSLEEIKEACDLVHSYGKRAYVTVNIVFHNNDVDGLKDYLIELKKANVDAIILSDPLVIDVVNKHNIGLEMHLSTQQNTLNYEACNFFYKKGVTRVVLGREASKDDIISIKENSKVEIETFIHGAMCVGYSGRCVLSNYFTNRDSNRGGCSQICRWHFKLFDRYKNLIDDDFSFSVKDLSMAKHLNELINLGISSFKIEGRMRSIYYVATILNVYRGMIDEYYEFGKITNLEKYEYLLNRCANRESIPQFFIKKPGVEGQYYLGREEQSNKEFLGVVKQYDELRKEIVLEQRNFFKVGDEITIFGPNIKTFSLKVEYIKDELYNDLDAARHPLQIVRIKSDTKVFKDNIIRIKFEVDKG